MVAKRLLSSIVTTLLVISLGGCAKVTDSQATSGYEATETEFVLAIVLDMSGSFADEMAVEGVAYDFLLKVINRYTREMPGSEGQLIITQVSASANPLIWEGTPRQLHQDFSSPEQFRDFLLARADPSGSHVYQGIATTMRYLQSHHAVRHGARPGLFVLSDLLDTTDDANSHALDVQSLMGHVAEANGIVGFYYVHQHILPPWREMLQQSAVHDFRIEPDFVSDPSLPSFQ